MAAELVVAAVPKRGGSRYRRLSGSLPHRENQGKKFFAICPIPKNLVRSWAWLRHAARIPGAAGNRQGSRRTAGFRLPSPFVADLPLLINYYARPWPMGRNFAVARGWWSRSRCAGEQDGRSSMSENKRDYGVGRGKPPVHGRFKKGQSGNPRRPLSEKLAGIACRGAQRDGGRDHRRRAPGRPRADRTRRRWSSSTIPFRNRIAAVKPHYFGNISRCISARDPSRSPSFVFGTALPRPLKRPCRRDRGTARSVGIAVISQQRRRRRGWPLART